MLNRLYVYTNPVLRGAQIVVRNQTTKAIVPYSDNTKALAINHHLKDTVSAAVSFFKTATYCENKDLVYSIKNSFLTDITIEKDYKKSTYYFSIYFSNTPTGIARYKTFVKQLPIQQNMIQFIHEPHFGRSKVFVEIKQPIVNNGELQIQSKLGSSTDSLPKVNAEILCLPL
ncbi:hypothetical protein DID76_04050 [Candidatus Marinamargulisbacteria bacterium SCGC AG-414-C22]|nr:hypothetical protein DID76_04050 [Candidatus Marinamargulisbacteria bacterium SCGC AG-414-C22]